MGNRCVKRKLNVSYNERMITQLPTVPPAVMRAAPRKNPAAPRPLPRTPPALDIADWRYEPSRPAVGVPWLPLLASVAMHVVVLFGFNQPDAPEILELEELDLSLSLMQMPPVEELDDKEEVFDPDASKQEELDPGAYVPMQADVPSIVTDSTFIQQLDFQSLLPKPDFDAAKVVSIPSRIAHGSVSPNQIKDLFNLGDLDRVPVPLLQQPPVFPRHLKNEVSEAEVVVDFIVGADGKVPWAKVYSSTHRGFEDSAILGVSGWQFRPGVKNGKKVATRMRVPLKFRVVADD